MIRFFLLFLAVLSCSADDRHVKVTSTSMHETSSSFKDVKMDFLNPRVTFEEDMYVMDNLYCSSTKNFIPNPPTCIPCNYSGAFDSNTGFCVDPNLNTNAPLTEEQKNTLPPCECDPSFCAAQLIKEGDESLRVDILASERKKVFKFEHSDWSTGFAVEVIPVAEGKADYFLSASPENDATKMFSYSSFTDPYENMMACPSFKGRFGGASETITYFIVIVPYDDVSSFDVRVRSIPSLTEEEDVVAVPARRREGTSFSTPDHKIGTPVLFEGDFLSTDGVYPRFYRNNLVWELDECMPISYHVEILHQNNDDANYFPRIKLSMGVYTKSLYEYSVLRATQPRPFKMEELTQQNFNRSIYFLVGSGGYVASVCPIFEKDDPNYEPTYVTAHVMFGRVFHEFKLMFDLRDARKSQHLIKRKLGEMNPVQFQRNLQPSMVLTCPCRPECENCTSITLTPDEDYRHFNRVSLFTEKRYVGLKGEMTEGCDIAVPLGVPYQRLTVYPNETTFQFRCLHPWRDSSCAVMRAIPMFEDKNPILYPMPEPLRLEGRLCSSATDQVERGEILNNAIGLLITKGIDNTKFFSDERLARCSASFPMPSRLMSFAGMPPNQDQIYFADTPKPVQECQPKVFADVSKQIQKLDRVLTDIVVDRIVETSGEDLNLFNCGAEYGAFELTFNDEWQSCQSLLNSFVNFTVVETIVENTDECITFDSEDPCCVEPLSWTDCCSAEGRSMPRNTTFASATNLAEFGANCASPECMEAFVDDYRDSLDRFNGGLCDLSIEFETPDAVVEHCKKTWIGHDELGFPCLSDADCGETFGTGRCDLSQKRCVDVRTEMERGFLQCLLTDLDSIHKSSLYVQMVGTSASASTHSTASILSVDFLHDFLKESSVVSDYGMMSPFRAQYEFAATLISESEQLCPLCFETSTCLMSVGCEIPLQCLDVRELCSPTLSLVAEKTLTTVLEDTEVCNWDHESDDCLAEEYACMFCHTPSNCVKLPAVSEAECRSTPICVTQNGDVLWDVSQEECETQRGACSELCQGLPCENEQQCLQDSGFCDDNELIMTTIQLAVEKYPSLAPAVDGVCVRPLNAFNSPRCPFVNELPAFVLHGFASGILDVSTGNSFDFTTDRGCILFSRCIAGSPYFGSGTGGSIAPSSCKLYAENETACADWNGVWLNLPIQDKIACENPLGLDGEVLGFCKEKGTPYLSSKSKIDCEDCGGIPTTPGNWEVGRWSSGLSAAAEWRKTEILSPYHFADDTISLVKLNSLIEGAIFATTAFRQENQVKCQTILSAKFFELITCECSEEEIECGEFNGELQTAWFCPGIDFKTGLLSGEIEVFAEDITGDICLLQGVGFSSHENFVGNRKSLPLTTLGDPNDVDPLPVRNRKGASVGNVVGDGFFLENFSNQTWTGHVAKIRVSLIGQSELILEKEKLVFDLGYEVLDVDQKFHKGEIEVRPLAVDVTTTFVVGSKDVQITGFWLEPHSYPERTVVYPIMRSANWDTEDNDSILSSGEQVMIGIFAGLYGLTFLILVFCILVVFVPPTLIELVILFFMMLIALFRTIYLSLFAAGHLQNEGSGSFVLVEPPSFFLITISSVVLLSCAFTAKQMNRGSTDVAEKLFGRFWAYWGVFTAALYFLMAVVLILLTQLDTGDKVTVTCFGRQVSVEEDFTIQAIRIAYHSLLFLIALVFGGFIFHYTAELEETLQIRSLWQMTIVTIISVLSSNLLWVIYSAVSGSSPYFVIPLWICEVVPMMVLVMLFKKSRASAE